MKAIPVALILLALILELSFATPHRSKPAPASEELQWGAVLDSTAAVRRMPELPTRVVSFETTEGSFMSIDVSPDGNTLVFDLLGDIYRMPIDGGDAIALTTGRAWDQAPRFSPDGMHVYFVSDREGSKNLWRLALGSRSFPQQLTRFDVDILGSPNWSQNRRHLIAGLASTDGLSAEAFLHFIDPADGSTMAINAPKGPLIDATTLKRIRNKVATYSGVETSDGKVFFSQAEGLDGSPRSVVRLYEFDRGTQMRTVVTAADTSHNDYKPQLSHDGNLLAFFRQYIDRRTELRILDRTTGGDELLTELEDADDAKFSGSDDSRPNFSFTPDDRSIVFWHDGKIRRVSVLDGSMEIIPFRVAVEREVTVRVRPTVQSIIDIAEATTVRWPSLSRDGRTMVFAAFGYIWVKDSHTGTIRRLTHSNEFEYMPALSPNGQSVAYIRFTKSGDEYDTGQVVIAGVNGEEPRTILAEPNSTFILPKWSSDGSKIALIRQAGGTGARETTFGWTIPDTGAFREVASVPPFHGLASYSLHALHAGFDALGKRLLFSYPQPSTDDESIAGAEMVLAGADLDGTARKALAVGTPDVRGIIAAPDMKRLALTRRDKSVWVIPFDAGEKPAAVSSLGFNARRISENGGYFVDWTNSSLLTFSFGNRVFRHHLPDGQLQTLRIRVPFVNPRAGQAVAFEGARIITMSGDVGTGDVIDRGTVLVEGTRIAAIAAADSLKIPPEAQVVDVSGKTILPGLLDTHYHWIGRGSWSAFVLPARHFGDESAAMAGITSAWDAGGPVDDGAPAKADLQAAGRIAGPRWFHAAEGGVGAPYESLTGYAAAATAVERHRDLGVVVLKEYLAPTRQQRQWLVAAASEQGLGIVSHLQGFDGVMTRIVDGYTGGDHAMSPMPFSRDVFELMRQTGYIWTPNALIVGGVVGEPQDRILLFCEAVAQWASQDEIREPRMRRVCGQDGGSPVASFDTHRVGLVARQVASAASNGVHIGVSAHNMPGYNLHREMWLLQTGGMPIEEVLRAATMTNAEKLGLQEEIGSLKVGKIADFLVLDENPLDDILNTLSLRYTVQGGVVYDSATAHRIDVSKIAETTSDSREVSLPRSDSQGVLLPVSP